MTRRFMLYSHDSFGLGHFRRSLSIAAALVAASPRHEALIVTGSPLTQSFELPERVDTLKLPVATKNEAGAYVPRKLGGDLERLVRLRAGLILAAFEAYAPDVVLVDHAPIGLAGELLPLLQHIDRARPQPRLVLGMRDVIDDAERVRKDWERSDTWSWLGVYDDVLVYGDERVLTTAQELRLAERIRGHVRHTGYLAPVMPSAEPPREPFVLVTAGGGGDGFELVSRYLDYAEAHAAEAPRSLIVSGPLMSGERRASLEQRVDRLPRVTIETFTPAMRALVASAAAVVSMAGYNTVVEELAARVPALLVPRSVPRLEQRMRADRLSAITHLESAPPEGLDSAHLAAFVDRALTVGRTGECGVRLDGLAATANALSAVTA